MDTGLIEILSLSTRTIECTLLKCYVEEISLNINALVLENCKGCVALDSFGRIKHFCPMMSDRDKVWFYFNCALERASEENIVRAFICRLQDMKLPVNGLELLRHTYQDTKASLRRLRSCDFIELKEYLKEHYDSIMSILTEN